MTEVHVELADADATRAYGRALAALLRPGDLVLLAGPLGSGKTTLTQGLGAGLGVRGQVASPTFIIARVHPSLGDGPPLVHVDAYRLGSMEELDALDLDAGLDESVTVVEWGEGLAEVLAEDRLEVEIVGRAPETLPLGVRERSLLEPDAPTERSGRVHDGVGVPLEARAPLDVRRLARCLLRVPPVRKKGSLRSHEQHARTPCKTAQVTDIRKMGDKECVKMRALHRLPHVEHGRQNLVRHLDELDRFRHLPLLGEAVEKAAVLVDHGAPPQRECGDNYGNDSFHRLDLRRLMR